MSNNWPPRFTIADMTPAQAGAFLRKVAALTAGNSQDWDNFEAIATQIVTDAYKGGQLAAVTACESGAASPAIGSVPNTAAETDGTNTGGETK